MILFLLALSDESNHYKIEHIYNKYHDYMIKYAVLKFCTLGRDNPTYDAEDAVQNAFMKIVKYIDKIDFSRSEKDIKNYCFSILCNEIYTVLNEKDELLEIDQHETYEDICSFIEKLNIQEKYNKVVNKIESMDERYSTTLYLVLCEDMSIKDTAELMGIPAKTVYTRVARGVALLRESLKEVSNDE